MVRVLLALAMIWVFGHNKVEACDACGCSALLNGMGLMTNLRSNTISLSYLSSTFTGHPNHGSGANDQFQIVDIGLRHRLGKRLIIDARIPYRHNRRHLPGIKQDISGVGDLRLSGGYIWLKDKSVNEGFQLYAESVLGVSIPTGPYDASLHEQDIPENFNTGIGAWGYLWQNNMALTGMNHGILLNTSLQFHNQSDGGYLFGSQFSVSLLAYWEKRLSGAFSLTPQAGYTLEHVKEDLYSTSVTVPGTGGKGGFLTAGLSARYDILTLGFSWQQVLHQYYSQGEVLAKARYTLRFTLNI